MKRISVGGVALVMVLGTLGVRQPACAQQITASITNTVQVSSEAPQLQADTTQVSTLIDANTIVGIPLSTRNYVELTLLAPGSVTPDNSTSEPF